MIISDKARRITERCEQRVEQGFKEIERNALTVQERVLNAFAECKISTRHFAPSYGYGYDDIGRDSLDRLFAMALEAEDALVRPQLANGTHGIYLALSGLLEPNDKVLSISGKPYDTLESAIGLSGNAPNALKCFNITFNSIELINGRLDLTRIEEELKASTPALIYVQRSRGYEWRNALSIAELSYAFERIRMLSPQSIIFVDNCYGEFVEAHEPVFYGADVMCSSLIKNLGGGLAPTGACIAGKREYIERIAQRLTVPGTGREVGSYAASYMPFYQGLFMAPHATAQCLKTALLFAALFEELGYETLPSSDSTRSDIIQSIRFKSEEELIDFCRAIQEAAPVDSFVVPEPWEMPGYSDRVIMAAGTFIQGATSELSCDAPLRKPYTVYLQGALSYEHGKIAAMRVVDRLMK